MESSYSCMSWICWKAEYMAYFSTGSDAVCAAYWTHAGNPTAAAQTCSMSRATFYRHLRTALTRLARIL